MTKADDGSDAEDRRSQAYEVALIDDRISREGSFLMDDLPLDNLMIDEPEPLSIKIDLGGGKFASILA